jgi:uncharacterized protein YbjT (DUF2867 family)
MSRNRIEGGVVANLATGDGLDLAVQNAEVIVHAASSPGRNTGKVDVDGTARLLDAGKNIRHFIYVSIVGIDRIPMSYYKHKLKAEQKVRESGVPWTIVRATQFHSFIDALLCKMVGHRIGILPQGWQFQSIDVTEVAENLCDCVSEGAQHRVLSIGGPKTQTLREMAEQWLRARGKRSAILPLPIPGKASLALRQGWNTQPSASYGKITWEEWLKDQPIQRPKPSEI